MTKNEIDAKTKIVILLGDPVEHSLSPAMQNAAFQHLQLNYIYLAAKVESARLKEAIAGLRAMNFAGANITIPHKVAVLPHLDQIDPLAEKIGACNTVVND